MSKNNKKLINVQIAPYNWERIKMYIEYYNDKPDRTTSKLKYIDVINQAIDEFFQEIETANSDKSKK